LLLAVMIGVGVVTSGSHATNQNNAIPVVAEHEPAKPKPESQAEPGKPKAIEAKTQRPAIQVCGPDHWVKDHWEPSCR
jgi:hypothetical protein